jgi:hypothetical protein
MVLLKFGNVSVNPDEVINVEQKLGGSVVVFDHFNRHVPDPHHLVAEAVGRFRFRELDCEIRFHDDGISITKDNETTHVFGLLDAVDKIARAL